MFMHVTTKPQCELPRHITDIWVHIDGVKKRMRFSVFLFKEQLHACEPTMNYTIPMYKGPLSFKDGDKLPQSIKVVRERAKMGLENRIAERGLAKVLEALYNPTPQMTRLDI